MAGGLERIGGFPAAGAGATEPVGGLVLGPAGGLPVFDIMNQLLLTRRSDQTVTILMEISDFTNSRLKSEESMLSSGQELEDRNSSWSDGVPPLGPASFYKHFVEGYLHVKESRNDLQQEITK